MDLNADGNIDILSGSYSRMTQDMAGLFHVLYGTDDGKFKKATVVNGTDGEPLIVPASEEDMVEKICTRPTAADINGDGHLDIVTGNFAGTFYVFKGVGKGAFSSECSLMKVGDDPIRVPSHSDPFLVDWDDDGDLDIVSGAAQGGVYLSVNKGTRTEPKFAQATELIPATAGSHQAGQRDVTAMEFGDASVKGPSHSSRVWVADINGDRKLDVLVGDSTQLIHALEGRTEEETRRDYAAWLVREMKHSETYPQDGDKEASEAWSKKYMELFDERDKLVNLEDTGFVWVYYQK